jgi:hypothetical protein
MTIAHPRSYSRWNVDVQYAMLELESVKNNPLLSLNLDTALEQKGDEENPLC